MFLASFKNETKIKTMSSLVLVSSRHLVVKSLFELWLSKAVKVHAIVRALIISN